MKTLTTILAASAATVIGLQAFAQTTAPAPTTPAPTAPAPMSPAPSAPSASAVPDIIFPMATAGTYWRSSEVIGKPVYTRTDERVGEIDELLFASDGRVLAAVVGVGGFLGMGERKVALSYPAIMMTRDASGNLRASVAVSKEMLQSAPEFKAAKSM